MNTTDTTCRFLATARRQRFAMLRDLCEALALAGLGCATFLALI
jgi:hypothetical protein